MRVSLLIIGLVAGLAAGCTKPASQLVIGILTNLSVSGELDQVQMDISRESVHLNTLVWPITDHMANFTLPGSINIDADNGASPVVQLTVTGFKNNQSKVVRQSNVQLLAEQQLFYRMALVLSCEGAAASTCPDGLHCVEGICKSDAVDAATFLPYAEARVNAIECDSHTNFIDTATCAANPPSCTTIAPAPNGCDPGDFCSEGTCYKRDPSQPRQLEFGERCTPGVDTCRVSSMFVCANTPNGGADANCRERCTQSSDCQEHNPGSAVGVPPFVPPSCIISSDTTATGSVCTFPCNPLATGPTAGCFNGICSLIDNKQQQIVPDCVSKTPTDGTIAVGQPCSSRLACVSGSTCTSLNMGAQTCHSNCIVCEGQSGCAVTGTTSPCPGQCLGLFVVGQSSGGDPTYGVCP